MSGRLPFEGTCATCGCHFSPMKCSEHHLLANALRASHARIAELEEELVELKLLRADNAPRPSVSAEPSLYCGCRPDQLCDEHKPRASEAKPDREAHSWFGFASDPGRECPRAGGMVCECCRRWRLSAVPRPNEATEDAKRALTKLRRMACNTGPRPDYEVDPLVAEILAALTLPTGSALPEAK